MREQGSDFLLMLQDGENAAMTGAENMMSAGQFSGDVVVIISSSPKYKRPMELAYLHFARNCCQRSQCCAQSNSNSMIIMGEVF